MKFKQGSLANVLWLMFLLLISIIVMMISLSFSSLPTIDSYVKNIINEEVSRFVSSISGYSTTSSNCNMYNSLGQKRQFGAITDAAASSFASDTATANSIVNLAKDTLVSNITDAFTKNSTLKTKTLSSTSNSMINSNDITVKFTENNASTLVTITLNYKVKLLSYENKVGGFLNKSIVEIPRKVIVTRNIENPLRFKN